MVRQVLAVDEEAPTPVHRLAYACAEDPAHAPPPTLLEETLLEEDRAATDRRRASLKLGPFERDGLGLAFSGGGVRAASFQSGVLWRMAELNLLKEVDHLSAVSRAPRRRSSAGSAPRSHPPGSKEHFFIPSRHAVAAPHRLGRTARHRRDT